MVWVRLDDQFAISRKVAGLSDAAFRLHIAALCWSARNLMDGLIPREDMIDVAGRLRQPERLAVECVARHVWHNAVTPCGSPKCPAAADVDGWRVHDYLEYQFSKEQVTAQRERTRARQRRFRDTRNAVTNAVGNAVSNAYPVPSRFSTADVVDLSNGSSGSGGSRNGVGNGVSNGVTPAGVSPETIDAILNEIKDKTGRTVSADYATRVAGDILGSRTVANPVAYVRRSIRDNPQRFAPSAQPPPVADVLAATNGGHKPPRRHPPKPPPRKETPQ